MSALKALALLVLCSHTVLRAQDSPLKCGVERWPVKIALDADAARIDIAPVWASVSQLRQLPRPNVQLPHNQRVGPYELKRFHVIAVVRQVLSEDDGDLHIVMQDVEDPNQTMVAEIPDSACALGSRYASAFAEARRQLRTAPRDAIVVLDGVGFFDFIHGQRGVAPNGFELHPILGLRVIGQFLAEARPDSSVTSSSPKVWVNTSSRVYHCAGTRWYGATKRGAYMTEREAMAAGAHPAYGRRCGT